MYLSIIILPLINFFLLFFFGKFFNKNIIIFSLFIMIIDCFLSFFIFYEIVLSHSICVITLFPWIETNFLLINWGFLFDNLTSVMLIVVTFVSALVHIYSYGYMQDDPHLLRFFSYLSLFTFFMLMLITGDNYVQLFLGWEGVGLASYLLINFWYTRIQANKAAMKAIIVNKIGDFALSLGIALIFYTFLSLDFFIIFNIMPFIIYENIYFFGIFINKVTLISLLLFIGAVGKSAQIGLHIWLPDAMEGPTPVSALIHAATMVTAGVFLILRSSPIIEYSDFTLFIISFIGCLTAFLASTIGIVQNDLKKVIAYSTCSQLGYMILACGVSNYSISLFHLMNHAFFKALLFLSAGSVIHAMADEQDMRKMGGIVKIIPITYLMILVGSFALMGFPYLAGFYSKDILLELNFGTYHFSGLYLYWLGTFSAFFTSFYSIRLIFITFLKYSNSTKQIIKNVHESSLIMLIPLVILFFGSIFVGFLFKDLFIGLGVDTWNTSLLQLINHVSFYEAEFLSFELKLIPLIFSLSGLFFSIYVYKFNSYFYNFIFYKKIYLFYKFFIKKWYFDNIYLYFIIDQILYIGYNVSFKLLDRGILEYIGPFGLIQNLKKIINKIAKLQSGFIYHYALVMFMSFFIFIFIFTLPKYLIIEVSYILIIIYFYYSFDLKNLKIINK